MYIYIIVRLIDHLQNVCYFMNFIYWHCHLYLTAVMTSFYISIFVLWWCYFLDFIKYINIWLGLFSLNVLDFSCVWIFSCDQAALWMVFSVRLSVCPSVCPSVRLSVCPSVTPFWLCSHHRIIMKFSGVITLDQGKVHAKGQGQRSKVKVTEVTTQIFVSGL